MAFRTAILPQVSNFPKHGHASSTDISRRNKLVWQSFWNLNWTIFQKCCAHDSLFMIIYLMLRVFIILFRMLACNELVNRLVETFVPSHLPHASAKEIRFWERLIGPEPLSRFESDGCCVLFSARLRYYPYHPCMVFFPTFTIEII